MIRGGDTILCFFLCLLGVIQPFLFLQTWQIQIYKDEGKVIKRLQTRGVYCRVKCCPMLLARLLYQYLYTYTTTVAAACLLCCCCSFSRLYKASLLLFIYYITSPCVCVIISTRSGREGEDVCHVLHMIIYYIVYTLLLLLMWSVHLAHIQEGGRKSPDIVFLISLSIVLVCVYS